VRRLITALLLVSVWGLGFAMADNGPPPVPDPQNLSADWWTYFEPAEPLDEQVRGQRLDEARSYLLRYRQRLESEKEAEQARLVDKILTEMGRFEELKSAPPPIGKPTKPAAESYTLEEALQRHAAWRTLEQEVTAESEESNWQNVVIAEERKQQARRRTAYLELDDADPNRLQAGLELMLSRLRLELQRLEPDRRKSVLRLAEQRLELLQAELDAIPGRLSISPGDGARWQKRYEDAEASSKKLREEIDQTKLFEVELTDSSQDLSEAQYAVVVAATYPPAPFSQLPNVISSFQISTAGWSATPFVCCWSRIGLAGNSTFPSIFPGSQSAKNAFLNSLPEKSNAWA
jgi:hypothetical protein